MSLAEPSMPARHSICCTTSCKQSDSLDEMGRQTDISSCQLFAFNLQSCYEVVTVDPSQQPSLHVLTDSDFASCPYTAKSTSGIVYVIKSGDQHYPVMWQSKKQSSIARSTTEAELIAFASALFGESLHLHTMLETLTESKVEKLSLNRTIRQRLPFLKLAIVLNFVEPTVFTE